MAARKFSIIALAGLGLAACTTAELEAISAGLAQGLSEASYEMAQQPYGYASPYSGSLYSPSTFSTYGGWPSAYSYGQYVGPFGCSHTGSFYTCDSNGDGYADMYGNTDDGSYSSSHLRVNGRGEAYTWDSECSCWGRERSLDGPRTDTHDHYYEYDHH